MFKLRPFDAFIEHVGWPALRAAGRIESDVYAIYLGTYRVPLTVVEGGEDEWGGYVHVERVEERPLTAGFVLEVHEGDDDAGCEVVISKRPATAVTFYFNDAGEMDGEGWSGPAPDVWEPVVH